LIQVIREKKALLLLSNLILAFYQKKIGRKLGITPGAELLEAIQAAESVGARIHLADRDIRITLSRLWRALGFWKVIELFAHLFTSIREIEDIDETAIERMKEKDVLDALLSELGTELPRVREIVIDERDQYLAHRIRTSPGKRIVAVVGAGHVPGIQEFWESELDIDTLMTVPPKRKAVLFLKWGIPCLAIVLILLGFVHAGSSGGSEMIKWWVLINAILAGAGAAIACAHPVTILSALLASPLTSLNPAIAAGWVAGLVQVLVSRPKVKDFQMLLEDIISLKGFWLNRITRVLLVVVFTNFGSALGTFVAIPFMAKFLV
jgi:pheromone shutdown-related protein TraB